MNNNETFNENEIDFDAIQAQLATELEQGMSFRTGPFFLAALNASGDLELIEWQPDQALPLPPQGSYQQQQQSIYQAA